MTTLRGSAMVITAPVEAIADFCRTGCGDTKDGSCLRAECPLREFCPLPLLTTEKADVGARLDLPTQMRLAFWKARQSTHRVSETR
jgi:hypothetical protein